MRDFTCPRCGGHYFGRDVVTRDDGTVELRPLVRCHSDANGRSFSEPGPHAPPCGWQGDPADALEGER